MALVTRSNFERPDDAFRAIVEAHRGLSDEVSAEMMKAVQEPVVKEEPISLTPREIEIVKLVAKEYSNAQIAETLFISERTVETHRKNIFRKTNTKSVVGLIRFAIDKKLLD